MLHSSRQRGSLAEFIVAYRFLEAGRLVSWPLTACAYDLVVDVGDRLLRVQVKQAHDSGEASPCWRVRLTRRHTGGKDVSQRIDAFDVLCVVANPATVFVIPTAMCCSIHDTRLLAARIEIGPKSRRAATKSS